MSFSPTGVFHRVRPYLGRAKRAAVQRRDDWSPSGSPNPVEPRPPDAVAATRTFFAALALEKRGQHDAAVARLAESLELDGRFERRWTRYADLLASTGRADLAIDAYRTAHECDPSSFRPLLAIVTLELQLDVDLGDPDEAVVEASRIAIGQVTADPQLDFLIAVSQSRELDDRVARERFRRSLDAEPDRPERLLAYARFEAERGRWDEAADAYRRAIATTDTGDSGSEVSVAHLADQLGLDEPAIRNDDWAALASVARIMVDDDPAGCEGHRMLGLALCELEQWTDALAPLQEAVNCRPTDLHVLEKLAHSASQAGRHDLAVDARQRSLTVDPTARRFHALAVDLQVAGREEEAARAFEHSVRLGLPSSTWFERFGAAQRRTSAWSGAAVLYRWALERHPDGAHLWYLLGFSLEHAGEPVEAEHAYRRAIDLQPDNANWWFRLGYLLERFGPPRTVVQPRTGLEQSSAGDYSQAADCYRRAIELDGTRVAFLRRLAGVEELLGDLDSAQATLERAIELDADDATTWHLLGRTIATRANRRGMYHTEEHDQLERIWGKAIELQPYRSGPRDQLTRASIKAARWKLANEVAWFPVPSSAPAARERVLRRYMDDDGVPVGELASELARPSDELLWVPKEWWFPLHWKLLTENHFTLAYRAKKLMAERTLSDGAGSPNENLPQYLEHARSLTFLGRNDLALDELTPSLLSNMSDRIRRTFSRQAADVSLLLGDPGPHVELLPTDLDPHVRAAEAAFDELVRGRRIAIVGPGQSDLGSGAEIDDHDVVIRTKFVSDQLDDHVAVAGSRTDVSYYALGSAQFMRADIIEAIETGGLKMAVFRSATYTPDPPYLVRPGDIRYVPSEFTAGLRASQFAIQRIFYDLLRYGPASIKVFNIDFFLSLDSYRPGYLAEYANRAEQQGFIKVLGAFGHDFLADFRFTRAMHRFGLLDVDANIERILELEPDEYLRALDRRS